MLYCTFLLCMPKIPTSQIKIKVRNPKIKIIKVWVTNVRVVAYKPKALIWSTELYSGIDWNEILSYFGYKIWKRESFVWASNLSIFLKAYLTLFYVVPTLWNVAERRRKEYYISFESRKLKIVEYWKKGILGFLPIKKTQTDYKNIS